MKSLGRERRHLVASHSAVTMAKVMAVMILQVQIKMRRQ